MKRKPYVCMFCLFQAHNKQTKRFAKEKKQQQPKPNTKSKAVGVAGNERKEAGPDGWTTRQGRRNPHPYT